MNMDWLGGFIDGEGCFSFAWRNGFVPEFRITNTNREALYLAKELLGAGRVLDYDYSTATYFLSGFKLLPVLKKILPHLIIKKQECELLIKYIELRLKRKYMPYNLEELGLIQKLSELHGRKNTKLFAIIQRYKKEAQQL